MKSVLQMWKMRKVLERECVCEDTKTRVYLSLVPSRAARIQRYKDTIKAVTKALRAFFGSGLTVVIQMLVSIGIAMLTYELIQIRMAPMRGYVPTIGGEIFLAPAVGVMVYKITGYLFRNWRDMY